MYLAVFYIAIFLAPGSTMHIQQTTRGPIAVNEQNDETVYEKTERLIPKELWKEMRKFIVTPPALDVQLKTTTTTTTTPQFWTANEEHMLLFSAILILACNMILTLLVLPLILRFYSRRRVNVGGKQNADGIHHI